MSSNIFPSFQSTEINFGPLQAFRLFRVIRLMRMVKVPKMPLNFSTQTLSSRWRFQNDMLDCPAYSHNLGNSRVYSAGSWKYFAVALFGIFEPPSDLRETHFFTFSLSVLLNVCNPFCSSLWTHQVRTTCIWNCKFRVISHSNVYHLSDGYWGMLPDTQIFAVGPQS